MNAGHTFALVGNPNVGKTTLFNALTGLSQVTGNYPGVTVERKVGKLALENSAIQIVDLPGTYSLAARSPDEMIVTDVLLGQQSGELPIGGILAVVDATNIERNLYLVSQLVELGKPLVIALNMIDLAKRRRIEIDVDKLSAGLGASVVPVCAHKRMGIDQLRKSLELAVNGTSPQPAHALEFPAIFRDEVDSLHAYIKKHAAELGRAVARVEALRVLIDKGGYAEKRLLKSLNGEFPSLLREGRARVAGTGSLPAVEIRSRYAWIRAIIADAVRKPVVRVVTKSDRIDYVLTHKVYGTLVFAGLMALVFQAIFSWAAPFMEKISDAFALLGRGISGIMPAGPLQSLLVDGVIAGVGGVVVFLPQIVILSLFIALLEDCGYMARAAFLMDRLLSKLGLSGQSFIPLLSSFACAIPGIMATRTISNKRDRFATILVAPLMSCSARLPVYAMMIAAFIPAHSVFFGAISLQGLTLFLMYGLGIAVAIPAAWLLKRTLLKGETPPFLLELPSYKRPQAGTVLRKVVLQAKEFLYRAGTIIVSISVVVWALAYFPRSEDIAQRYAAERAKIEQTNGNDKADALANMSAQEKGEQIRNSFLGRMGRAIEPVVKPLGWDWRIGMATIASFPAREVVVATLGTIFFVGSDVDETSNSLKDVLRAATWPGGGKLFTAPVALSLMVFFALCAQCGSTLAVIRRETGSWRWSALTFGYMTAIAYALSFIVFHAASFAGWGG